MDKFTNLNTNNPVITDIRKFYGLFDNIYRDPFVAGNSYIFITRPQLFIDMQPSSDNLKQMAYVNATREPNFVSFLNEQFPNEADKSLFASLSFNRNYTTLFDSQFLPIFTNNCKNFDPSDTNLEQMEAFETKQGFKQVLPTFTTISETSGNLTINVTEDSNLSFTKLMNLWVKYIANVTDGTFDANPEMIKSGTLDYMCSIYYFTLDVDGKTISYWAKYTGCWPTSIPYGSFRYNKGSKDPVELDLQFAYTVKEDMNPKILEEFNITSLNLSTNEIPSTIINGLYSSYTNSPLLNIEAMAEMIPAKFNSIKMNDSRDPLVFYVNSSDNSVNPDSKKARFELSFGQSTYTSPVINDILENEEYYINYSGDDNLNNDNSVDYNKSTYWK